MNASVEQKSAIVYEGWGSFCVYPATVEMAKKLLEEKIESMGEGALPSLALMRKLKFNEGKEGKRALFFVPVGTVRDALKDLTSLKVGEASRALYRVESLGELVSGTKTPVSKEYRDEAVLWLFEHQLKADGIWADALKKAKPESLSFMRGLVGRAKKRTITYVDDRDLDEAAELKVLLHGTWKENAAVDRVVARYLSVLNEWSHRDEKYHLANVKDSI